MHLLENGPLLYQQGVFPIHSVLWVFSGLPGNGGFPQNPKGLEQWSSGKGFSQRWPGFLHLPQEDFPRKSFLREGQCIECILLYIFTSAAKRLCQT
jgi:hypothetical protein